MWGGIWNMRCSARKRHPHQVWKTWRVHGLSFPEKRPRNGKQNWPSKSLLWFGQPWVLNHGNSPTLENVSAMLEYMRRCLEQEGIHVWHSDLELYKHGPRPMSNVLSRDGQRIISTVATQTLRRNKQERGTHQGSRWCPNQPQQLPSLLKFKAKLNLGLSGHSRISGTERQGVHASWNKSSWTTSANSKGEGIRQVSLSECPSVAHCRASRQESLPW